MNETEIRNSIQEAVIRQSLNKPLYQENTLPVIRQEKVNKVIYETNATYLPVIYGGKKLHIYPKMSLKISILVLFKTRLKFKGMNTLILIKSFKLGK